MKIASFNVQKFGKKKASDPNIMRILAKVDQKVYLTNISYSAPFL